MATRRCLSVVQSVDYCLRIWGPDEEDISTGTLQDEYDLALDLPL